MAIIILVPVSLVAQDGPLFTPYVFNFQAINPAYVGIWEQTGITSSSRFDFVDSPHKGMIQMLSLYSPLRNEFIGAGLNIMYNRFSPNEQLTVYADYSYEMLITHKKRLRMGMKLGFVNYQNRFADRIQNVDNQSSSRSVNHQGFSFIPNFGFGAFLYDENSFISFSIPKIVKYNEEDYKAGLDPLTEINIVYLSAGYVFELSNNLMFKPTMMAKAAYTMPSQLDLAAHFLLYEKVWLGAELRTGDALGFIGKWIINDNFRMGYAIDILSLNTIKPQVLKQTAFEFSLSYITDFYRNNKQNKIYF